MRPVGDRVPRRGADAARRRRTGASLTRRPRGCQPESDCDRTRGRPACSCLAPFDARGMSRPPLDRCAGHEHRRTYGCPRQKRDGRHRLGPSPLACDGRPAHGPARPTGAALPTAGSSMVACSIHGSTWRVHRSGRPTARFRVGRARNDARYVAVGQPGYAEVYPVPGAFPCASPRRPGSTSRARARRSSHRARRTRAAASRVRARGGVAG